MIRTFRIYQLTKRERLTESKVRSGLERARLSSLVEMAKPPLRRLLSDLAARLTNERLRVTKVTPRRWELALTGSWPGRTITVATEVPSPVPVRVSVWIGRAIPWIVVFEANRDLSQAVSRLIASVMAGDPSAVDPLTLDLPHWRALEKWADESKDSSGAILGGRFYEAKPGGTDVEWVALRCSSVSNRKLLRECMKTAEGIGDLLIQTPRLKALKGNLVCRVGRNGVIRVYEEEIADEVIDALLAEFEVIWGFIPKPLSR